MSVQHGEGTDLLNFIFGIPFVVFPLIILGAGIKFGAEWVWSWFITTGLYHWFIQ